MEKSNARGIVVAKITQLTDELAAMNLVLTTLDTGDQLNQEAVDSAVSDIKTMIASNMEQIKASVETKIANLG